MITAVNYHLWEPCNMRCKFCFATFQDLKNSILPKGHLPEDQAIQVVRKLAEFGFEKITFAGGEPTLCPWIGKLIRTAKELGLTTMIVTNGTRLSDSFLKENEKHLDWIALSIDSLKIKTNLNSGRAIIGKRAMSFSEYKELVSRIKKYNYGLKINTVVHSGNVTEDLSPIINYAKPSRWKIFQVLPIIGQNDKLINQFTINKNDFNQFIARHKHLKYVGTKLIVENNDDMRGSYAMIDPAGRFYENKEGKYKYSSPILEVGCEKAYIEANYSETKFSSRGGLYEWKMDKPIFSHN